MLFSIEIAQSYTADKPSKQEAFYKSMLLASHQALAFMSEQGILYEFKARILKICQATSEQNWPNNYAFDTIVTGLD